ncbi:TMEM175 family protein [Actinoplanes sp. NPDC051851]|uniref:TMEM175 family protein n=1 Tax=Actinoplanes sp. NPDC051851 TaxID=3154753 RepID=UPI00341971E0
MQNDEMVPAGYTTERVGFFTDAVFAIAMTLLVIDIPKPEEGTEFEVAEVGRAEAARNLLHFLYEQIPSFSAYLLAFYILWVVWRQHHQLLDRLVRMSPGLIRLHFPLLLLAGLLPYATTVYDHNTLNPAAAGLFTVAVATLLLLRSGVQRRALNDGLLRDDVDLDVYRRDARISWIVGWYFLATLLFCWFTPWLTFLWFGAPLLGGVLNRRAGLDSVRLGG